MLHAESWRKNDGLVTFYILVVFFVCTFVFHYWILDSSWKFKDIKMISEDRVEKALKFLRETDTMAANAKSLMVGLEEQKKTILATVYLNASGSQGDKKEIALASESYREHLEKYKSSVYDFEELRNRRQTEVLIIETWRSQNANMRRGNI